MNHVALKGVLGRDPELKYTNSGIAVATASLALTKQFEKDGEKKELTTWVELKGWRETAEKMAKAPKGAPVYVLGELTTESWDDKDTGKKRSKTLVTVQAITSAFSGGKKAEKPAEEAPAPVIRRPAPKATAPAADVDDDVPF